MDDRALVEVCAALAAARRRLAAGRDAPLADLSRRLTDILAADARSATPPALIAALDELAGLVGQLELEQAALGSRLATLGHHRRARRSYALGSSGA